ncbi:thiamine phosphate synthase [Vibrio atypicus]|uniref:thiamine phosphate synthase n=1 Tax=Vibrio atypicus TaxID=558271 RepID=UPI00373564F3
MKMRILVPSSIIDVTGEIQACLSLAKQQGFDIDNIELGVSPTQLVELVFLCSVTTISSDIISTDLYDSNHQLLYQEGTFLDSNIKRDNVVHLSIEDRGVSLDVWRHPSNGEVRALSSKRPITEAQRIKHFAWVITLLALDFPIEDSLTLARAQLNVSRETWACEYNLFPVPVLNNPKLGIVSNWYLEASVTSDNALAFDLLNKESLGLYPVVDDIAWIERLLALGVTTIQLRIKNSQQADLEHQIVQAIELGKQYQAQVFINDYWQLAIEHGAFGVHLGQEDINEANLDELAQANVRLGLSTHGYYELLRITQITPSYIALGHIFPTTTKQMPSLPQGLVRLKLYQQLIDTIPYGDDIGFPTVAIGGIDLTNANQVWQCGVSSLAVVRAVTLSDDPKSVVDAFAKVMSPVQRTESIAEVTP